MTKKYVYERSLTGRILAIRAMSRCLIGFLKLMSILVVADVSHAAKDPRHVPLDGQTNFRDLGGGYETTDDRVVKWGEIYRSGELPRLSDKDLDRIESLDLRTVVNFLTPEETEARGKDRLPGGIREIAAPLSDDIDNDLAQVVLEARKTGDFSSVLPEFNADIHRVLIKEATAEYAALLRAAADPVNRPLVFHCSHGVHRTGTAAAVLLSALGVPWETVREDYLLSNKYRAEEIDRRLEELKTLAAEKQGVPPETVDTTNMEAFYRLQGSYIDASLDEAVQGHGSMEAYIRNVLGLTDEEIKKLRDQLLISSHR
ncbi:MAG: tyrosine-protein phosphatase [Arenicellales bacterium]